MKNSVLALLLLASALLAGCSSTAKISDSTASVGNERPCSPYTKDSKGNLVDLNEFRQNIIRSLPYIPREAVKADETPSKDDVKK